MSKLLKTIMRRSSPSAQHKKLSEEIIYESVNEKKCGKRERLEEDFACDGYDEDEIVSFKVKYLGSTVIEKLALEENASDQAVATILGNLKAAKSQKSPKTAKIGKKNKDKTQIAADEKKPPKKKSDRNVELTISPKGLCVMQSDQGVDVLKISIYSISNCRTHRQRIVSFLATNTLETTECHAFLCKARKTAEDVALAMARAFHVAYEQWSSVVPLRLEMAALRAAAVTPTPVQAEVCNEINNLLITFDDECDDPRQHFDEDRDEVPQSFGDAWVSFDESRHVDLLC